MLNLIMAVCFLASAMLAGRPMTPPGVHCVTAPVQSVFRDGSLKKPQLGDTEFKQCCCSERSQEQAGSSTLTLEPTSFLHLAHCPLDLDFPLFLLAARESDPPDRQHTEPLREPTLPPPDLA